MTQTTKRLDPYSDEGSVTARSENNALYLVYSAYL